MAQTATPILDLGTLVDRPKVRIDGKLYEMRTADEFSYLVYRQFQRKFQRLGELLKKRRTTQAEEKEQEKLLDEFVRQLVIAPEAVHARMLPHHRLEIIKAFFSLRPTSKARPAAATTRARLSGTK